MDIVAKGNGNQYFKEVMVSPDVQGTIASHAQFRQDNIGVIHFPKSWTDEMGMTIFDEDCNLLGIENEEYQFDWSQLQIHANLKLRIPDVRHIEKRLAHTLYPTLIRHRYSPEYYQRTVNHIYGLEN